MSEHLWRVEIELKRDMVDYWNDCFSDLHILQPDWKTIQRTADRAIVFMLLSDEEEWGKLHRNSRTKYKNLIKEISPVDLTDLMKSTLKANENNCKNKSIFGNMNLNFGNSVHINITEQKWFCCKVKI